MHNKLFFPLLSITLHIHSIYGYVESQAREEEEEEKKKKKKKIALSSMEGHKAHGILKQVQSTQIKDRRFFQCKSTFVM